MVSVAFAIWLSPTPARPTTPDKSRFSSKRSVRCPLLMLHAFYSASDVPVYEAIRLLFGFNIAWQHRQGRIRMMSMMYQAYENHMDLTAPWRTGAASALRYLNLVPQGVSDKL